MSGAVSGEWCAIAHHSASHAPLTPEGEGAAGQAVLRRYRKPASATLPTVMPRLQVTAGHAVAATGPPVSRPRIVSITQVTGWLAANPWSQDGSVRVGTNALLG